MVALFFIFGVGVVLSLVLYLASDVLVVVLLKSPGVGGYVRIIVFYASWYVS